MRRFCVCEHEAMAHDMWGGGPCTDCECKSFRPQTAEDHGTLKPSEIAELNGDAMTDADRWKRIKSGAYAYTGSGLPKFPHGYREDHQWLIAEVERLHKALEEAKKALGR